jgi:hypothetical protein
MPHSPYLPPELLQQIFRNLTFPSLLPCMRVSHEWNAALHGTGSVLYERLFQRTQYRPTIPETLSPQRGPEAAKLKLCLTAVVFKRRGKYILIIYITPPTKPATTSFHPILATTAPYLDIVNRYIPPVQDPTRRITYIPFSFTADLERKTRDQVGTFERVSWEDMLVGVPAIEVLGVRFEWKNSGEVEERVVRSEREVRVKDVVCVVRGVWAWRRRGLKGVWRCLRGGLEEEQMGMGR